MDKPASFQVHRFRESVALYIRGDEKGATVYFSPAEARQIAKALNGAAKDCRLPFAQSQFRTIDYKREV